MFPKMDKTFPDDDERKVNRSKYQMAIAGALNQNSPVNPGRFSDWSARQ